MCEHQLHFLDILLICVPMRISPVDLHMNFDLFTIVIKHKVSFVTPVPAAV